MRLTTSSNLQRSFDRHRPGTTFCLARGVYRLKNALVLKSNDVLVGRRGAILSGARRLRGWRRGPRYWHVDGQRADAVANYGVCRPAGHTGCRDANDVYMNDVALRRVMSLAKLRPRTFYFDHTGGRIYVGSDPVGKKMEVAVAPTAIQGVGVGAYNVTVKGLVVEKFASAPQQPAINAGKGWVVEGSEIRLNHAAGVAGATLTRDDYIHDNGQIGLGGACCDVVVDGNEVSYNNYAGFSSGWEAGGGKWANGSGLTVKGNYVHDNVGPGIWTDGSEHAVTIRRNEVDRNHGNGIVAEISFDVAIHDNRVVGNGLDAPAGWLQAAGILVSSSPNVEIDGNTVSRNGDGIALSQDDRGSDPIYGLHALENDYVHDNKITMTRGHSGLIEYVNDTSYYTARNNRFAHNTYRLGCGKTNYFIWKADTSSGYGEMPFSKWQAAGQDVTGVASRLC